MVDFTWVTLYGRLYMEDFKWVTLYGRLYLVDFTWTTIAGPAIARDYVRLNCYLNYKISHRSHFSTFSTFSFYSWSSSSFTASMEPNDAPTTAPSMEAPEVNRPVVPSRKRLQGRRLLRPHCVKQMLLSRLRNLIISWSAASFFLDFSTKGRIFFILPFSRSQSNGTLPGTTPSPTSWRQAKTKASFPGLVNLQNESFRLERPEKHHHC